MTTMLPPGWVWISVGELGASRGDLTDGPFGSNLKTEHYRDAGPRVIRLQNVGEGEFLDDEAHISTAHFHRLKKHQAEAGDIVVAMLGSELPRACLVPLTLGPAIVKADCVRVRPDTRILDASYVVAGLNSTPVRHQAESLVHGVGRPRLGLKWFRTLRFPLAPLPEQKRIMEALDSHISRLDAAVAGLERAESRLKAFRASVLKAAVEGRLVPTEAELARKEGRPLESADALLARILKERRRRWEEAELARMKTAGKTPKDDKWKAKYEEPVAPNTKELRGLPEGWCWVTAAAFFWDAGYGTSEKCTSDGTGRPVLRIPNVVRGGIDLDDLKFASGTADLSPDGEVAAGDFLFIRTNGSRSLIGKGALVLRRYIPAMHFASYLIRLRLIEVDDVARWFALAWHGPSVRSQLLKVAASSAGQHNVSLTAAASFAIPLPPLAEHTRILAELDRLESATAAVDEQVAKDLQRIKRLRQGILQSAFEGKLVDQDPADEPAEQMLARVRDERAVAVPIKKTRARKLKAAS